MGGFVSLSPSSPATPSTDPTTVGIPTDAATPAAPAVIPTTAVIPPPAVIQSEAKDLRIASSGEALGQPTLTPPAVIQSEAKDLRIASSGEPLVSHPTTPYLYALTAWHSLAWLTFANAIGVLLAVMLLFPATNRLFDTFTYGRWITVHLELELYGWSSLPLLAFLFKVYAVDAQPARSTAAQWVRPILWIWSTALAVGALTWITGHTSGKLFLDWTGYSRILFPLAVFTVWLLLAYAYLRSPRHSLKANAAKLIGLALLLLVPILLYISASPSLYPPINPATGGPTGASQLESTLVVVAILLLLPFGLTHRKAPRSRTLTASWIIFVAESLLCLGLGRADVSNHRPTQYISLASLLLWIPLIPAYFAAFAWHPNTRRWRLAFLWWWALLVPTGWALFLPSVLDHFKFTDGLVGHSLMAMAGFVTALLIFVLVELLGEGGWIFNRTWSFYAWNFGVLAYVVLMTLAGWREGSDPSFTILPGTARNLLYAGRLAVGVLMFLASAEWLLAASQLLREPKYSQPTAPEAP
jgi:cytochrome c oxidase cbb3-type subunit 1